MMRAPCIAQLAVALALATGGGFAAGVRAYEEGRFADSLAAFAEAEEAAGERASDALLYNKALAALRAGELATAEDAARRAAERGGEELAPLCDFVLGNAALARSFAAEARLRDPGVEPEAFDAAIASAESASRSWQRAATSRDDWPEARRNVERAVLLIRELEQRKDDARRRKAASEPEERALPEPLSEPPPDPPPEAEPGAPEPQAAWLSPEQVRRLFERLDEREREKRALRRARRPGRQYDVEMDW